MFKNFMAMLICLVAIMGLSACSLFGETPEDTIKKDIEAIVDSIDLSSYFVSDYVNESAYEFVESKYISRETNNQNKEDVVYYDIIVKNDYFEVVSTYKLTYEYNDDGGWSLSNKNIEKKTATPIRAAEENLIVDKWNEDKLYINDTDYMFMGSSDFSGNLNENKIDVTVGECVFDSEKLTSILNVSVNNSLTEMEGNISLVFNPETGWKPAEVREENVDVTTTLSYMITAMDCDYAEAEGVYAYTGVNEKYTLSFTIDEKNGIVDSVYTIDNGITDVVETKTQYDFNPVTGTFAAFKYYDSENDVWVGKSTTYERVY